MDLDGRAADFLVVHARHNVIVASLGAIVLVVLSLYGIWATRRASLLNLIRNAVDAIGDAAGGEVRLELRRHQPKGLTLSVIDNGPGLSEAARSRLFEPFFTTRASGTGLGPAITRGLVQSLGGELSMKPARPRGTEAILNFPGLLVREVELG